MGLEGEPPDIYDKLDEAYREPGFKIEYNYWVREGYENGYYDDINAAIKNCEEEYGDNFECDETDFREKNGYIKYVEIDEYDINEAKDEARLHNGTTLCTGM